MATPAQGRCVTVGRASAVDDPGGGHCDRFSPTHQAFRNRALGGRQGCDSGCSRLSVGAEIAVGVLLILGAIGIHDHDEKAQALGH